MKRAAEMLGIDDLLDRKPKQLSGGQKQRVALGRALVRDPDVFLLDEPLSNLDAMMRVRMREEIGKLHAATGSSMIYVTHDQIEAMTLGDRIAVMRDGRVQQVGPPLELYDRPANIFVASFIGSPEMNLIDGEIVQSDGRVSVVSNGLSIALPEGAAARLPEARNVVVGMRPEHLAHAGNAKTGFAVEVDLVEQMGAQTLLLCRAETASLRALVDRDDRVAGGDRIRLQAGASEHSHF